MIYETMIVLIISDQGHCFKNLPENWASVATCLHHVAADKKAGNIYTSEISLDNCHTHAIMIRMPSKQITLASTTPVHTI